MRQYLAALLLTLTLACLDPLQTDGQCTACADLEVLITGTCYPKLRGCLTYGLTGLVCLECQAGYVLDQGNCVREALFTNTTNSTIIPPVVLDNTTSLNFTQIQANVGAPQSYQFADVFDDVILHDTALVQGRINLAQKLNTKKGMFIIMTCSTPYKRYEVVYISNKKKQVVPLYLRPYDSQPRDPLTADTYLRRTLSGLLYGYDLDQVSLSDTNVYTFTYVKPFYFIVYQILFNMSDIGDGLAAKILVKTLLIPKVGY